MSEVKRLWDSIRPRLVDKLLIEKCPCYGLITYMGTAKVYCVGCPFNGIQKEIIAFDASISEFALKEQEVKQ